MTKTGRGRMYGVAPIEGFADRVLALKAAWLDEYRERVYDQIEDLPAEALDYVIGDTKLSIGRLVIHMAWAEAYYISKITGMHASDELRKKIDPGVLEDFSKDPVPSPPASDLIHSCRQLRNQLTIPALKPIEDADKAALEDGSTFRGVLGQLEWHWMYHSGQIGLIRLDWGSDYTWTRGEPIFSEGRRGRTP